MATPGPQQRPPSTITRINFPGGDGIVYFYYTWSYGGFQGPGGSTTGGNAKQPPPPSGLDLQFFFDGRELDGTPDFYIFADSPVKIVPSALPAAERAKNVPITDPITPAMLNHYAIWTPRPTRRDDVKTNFPPTDTWVVDTASYQLIYDNQETNRITPGGYTREQAIAEFIAADPTLDPTKVGAQLQPLFDSNGFEHPAPLPPSPEGWDFWSSTPGWAGHIEEKPTPPTYGGFASGSVIFNLKLLPLLIANVANRKTTKEVHFKLLLGLVSDQQIALDCWARPFLPVPGKPFAFPVNDKGEPLFVELDVAQSRIHFSTPANLEFADVVIGLGDKATKKDPSVELILLARPRVGGTG